MAEYKTFSLELTTTLNNGNAVSTIYIEDFDTKFKDKIEYFLDKDILVKKGGEYIDNIAEFLFNKAVDKLIEQKKEYRKTILNAYSDVEEE